MLGAGASGGASTTVVSSGSGLAFFSYDKSRHLMY